MVKGNTNESFVMSPRIDFVFKLIFGDDKNKDLLIALLSAILKMPKAEFEGIEIVNSELLREFQEDRKGILDVRARTREGEQIDIEIQILPIHFMPERTLFYWAKMYTGQVNPGDTYNKLRKCITINIVDFKCTPQKRPHSSYYLREAESGHKLTEVLEVHFLELPKLLDEQVTIDEDDPIVQWMTFIAAKSKGVMEVLADKNKDIGKAFDLLEIISKDEHARMVYEARQAEIRDKAMWLIEAEEMGMEKGMEEGMNKKASEIAQNLLSMGIPFDSIAKATGLTEEQINKLDRSNRE